MAPILKLFRATVGAAGNEAEYFFLQNPLSYEGSLDTVTGIASATDTEQDRPDIPVDRLLKKGILFRVTVRYLVGGGMKTSKLLVTRDKFSTALDALIGKTFRTGEIKKASVPTRATFF